MMAKGREERPEQIPYSKGFEVQACGQLFPTNRHKIISQTDHPHTAEAIHSDTLRAKASEKAILLGG
jgi:hypothetical protein